MVRRLNIGWKKKKFGSFIPGTIDPRLQQLYDDISLGLEEKEERLREHIANKDKKTFDGNGRLKMVSFANNPIQVNKKQTF